MKQRLRSRSNKYLTAKVRQSILPHPVNARYLFLKADATVRE
jgi:hypothetical protein